MCKCLPSHHTSKIINVPSNFPATNLPMLGSLSQNKKQIQSAEFLQKLCSDELDVDLKHGSGMISHL